MKVVPLFLLCFLFVSCKKETSTVSSEQKIFIYRLANVDLDSVVSYSTYASIKGSIDVITTEDDKRDCREHPNSIGCKTMPVILEYFKVYKSRERIRITWKPTVEYNLAFYELQRSEDGQSFKTVKVVQPKGIGIYDIEDN